jgi:hypothetical protein
VSILIVLTAARHEAAPLAIVPIPYSVRERYSGHEGGRRDHGEHYFLPVYSKGSL